MMNIWQLSFAILPAILCVGGQNEIKCYHCANSTHTYDCLKTETCYGPYESCFIHANYESATVSYTQGCMSSHLCNSDQGSSIIGRSVGQKKRQQMEFPDFECCNKSLCNIHDTEVSGLVFKVTTHIGGDDLMRSWMDGSNTVSDDYCRNVRTYGCSKHYRHPVVDNWLGIKRDLIKYALYKDEKEVASIWFNGTGSTNTDWFSHDRVINSTWTDLKQTPTNIFGIQGGGTRYFSIQKKYDGCPQDYGWTVIIAQKNPQICDYDNLNVAAPYILYAKANMSAHYPEGFDLADAAAVFIY